MTQPLCNTNTFSVLSTLTIKFDHSAGFVPGVHNNSNFHKPHSSSNFNIILLIPPPNSLHFACACRRRKPSSPPPPFPSNYNLNTAMPPALQRTSPSNTNLQRKRSCPPQPCPLTSTRCCASQCGRSCPRCRRWGSGGGGRVELGCWVWGVFMFKC